jgi:radical SAM protein (TIGR01212 family)
MNEPYYSFNSYLKLKFSRQKIRKIPINAGFNCPNKDGKLSDQGCIFCDNYGSGPVKTYPLSVTEQIETFIHTHPGVKYIAYYQAHSNTYAPIDELKEKFEIIFAYKDIIGLHIGTRPDAIREEVFCLLEDLNKKTHLCIELGLQSIHPKSLKFLNRNHTYDQFLLTFNQLKKKNIDTVIHLIVGIPIEDKTDMLKTVKEMNRLKPTGIKFHLIHVLRDTLLYQLYCQQKFKPMEQGQYIDTIVFLLEHLHPDIVIHRLTGEREKELFIAPKWALNKTKVINSIRQKMEQQSTFQGKKYKKI